MSAPLLTMIQIECFGPLDTLTFRILRRRWGRNDDSVDIRRIATGEGLTFTGYRPFLYQHGLTGVVLKHHATDIADIFGADALHLLQHDYLRLAADNQRNLRCLRIISQTLDFNKIDWVILKGIALSLQLYGDPNIRVAGDVDILVDPPHLSSALARLADAGFECIDPPPRGDSLMSWLHHLSTHQVSLRSPNNVHIEVHWRSDFFPQSSLPPLSRLGGQILRIPLDGIAIPCLSGRAMALQVSRHAYRSMWFRWKWLYDTIELTQMMLQTESDGEWAHREPTIVGSMRLAENLMSLESGTLLPAHIGEATMATADVLALRDSSIVKEWRVSGGASPRLRVHSLRMGLGRLLFQARAQGTVPARLRYLLWRIYAYSYERLFCPSR